MSAVIASTLLSAKSRSERGPKERDFAKGGLAMTRAYLSVTPGWGEAIECYTFRNHFMRHMNHTTRNITPMKQIA